MGWTDRGSNPRVATLIAHVRTGP
jgi:hypothetical protein